MKISSQSLFHRFTPHVQKLAYITPMIVQRVGSKTLGVIFLVSLVQTIFEAAKMIYLLNLVHGILKPDQLQAGALSLFGFDIVLPLLPVHGLAGEVGALTLTTFAVWMGQGLTSWLYARLVVHSETDLTKHIRGMITEKIFTLDIDTLTQMKTGRFQMLWQGARHIGFAYNLAFKVISSGLTLVGLSYLAFRIYPLGLPVVGGVWFFLWLVQRPYFKRILRISYDNVKLNHKAMANLEQFLYGMRIIKLARLESREHERHMEIHDKQANLEVDSKLSQQVAALLTEILGYALIIGLIGYGLGAGLDAGKTLGFALMLIRITAVVVGLAGQRIKWAEMHGPILDVQDFLERTQDRSDMTEFLQTQQPDLVGPVEEIRISDLHFQYVPERSVLNGVTAHFRRGEITALVGISGSGKSTFMDLLAGFRLPRQGKIEVLCNGQWTNIQDNLLNYRKRIGYASQEPIIFNETFEKNLKFFVPGASSEAVDRATQAARAEDVLFRLKETGNHELGQRGSMISGGQRQRVALARVFLQDLEVLLLDEATSAIDLYTEACIYRNLLEMKKDRIILVATHRLSAAARFDQIILFNNGRVAEQGTHRELLANEESLYTSLYHLQELSNDQHLEKLTQSFGQELQS